jgi:hypothetical protein
MPGRSWVASSLVSRPEIFCWVFSGRTPRSLMLFVGQILVSAVHRSTSAWRSMGDGPPSGHAVLMARFEAKLWPCESNSTRDRTATRARRGPVRSGRIRKASPVMALVRR